MSILLLIVLKNETYAQEKDPIQKLIHETDSILNTFTGKSWVYEISVSGTKSKSGIYCRVGKEKLRMQKKIKFRKGKKIEKIIIHQTNFGKYEEILKLICIDNDYYYIERTNYYPNEPLTVSFKEYLLDGTI